MGHFNFNSYDVKLPEGNEWWDLLGDFLPAIDVLLKVAFFWESYPKTHWSNQPILRYSMRVSWDDYG